MNTRHTPGPWRVDDGGVIKATVNGRTVQIGWINLERYETRDGDARLITAAPELADALRALVAHLLIGCPADGNPTVAMRADEASLYRTASAVLAVLTKIDGGK